MRARLRVGIGELDVRASAVVEVASALRRSGSAPCLARQHTLTIGQLPEVVSVALDGGLARQAAVSEARHGVREADAVFSAQAALFAAGLITFDREQLHRNVRVAHTFSSTAFLATAS